MGIVKAIHVLEGIGLYEIPLPGEPKGIADVAQVGSGGVNGARTRLIAWERKTYVGEEANQCARRRID